MGEGLFSYDILDAELAKLKNELMNEIKSLKTENTALQKTLDEHKREITELQSKQFSQRKIDSMIETKIAELKNSFVREKELGPLLNKDKDFKYILEHLKDLDKLAITKKQFNKFDVNVDKLRREASYLIKLAKEMTKLSSVEKELYTLKRQTVHLEKVVDAMRAK